MSELTIARARPDPRERFARQFFRVANPLVRRLMSAGVPTGSRNIPLTVRGRRSGTPRTTPLGMLELVHRCDPRPVAALAVRQHQRAVGRLRHMADGDPAFGPLQAFEPRVTLLVMH